MHCLLRPFYQVIFRMVMKIKLKHVCSVLGAIVLLDFFGIFTHVFEKTYDDNFVYPYEGDIHEFVSSLRHNQKPDVPPINIYNYTFIHDIKEKCMDSGVSNLRIVFLVKSAVENFDRRTGIRNSWGFEKRFSDVPFKTIFLLGTHHGNNGLRTKVNLEAVKYNDIVQADFEDSYYNNTIKTITGFKWAVNYCANSKFYMFVDDDMYLSVKNVLRFLRNPVLYPEYLTDNIKIDKRDTKGLSGNLKTSNSLNMIIEHTKDNRIKRATAKEKILMRRKPGWASHNKTKFPSKGSNESEKIKSVPHTGSSVIVPDHSILKHRLKRQVFDFELPNDVRLFAGYVFVSSPHRHKTSKWYVSLKEYPYHLWPPYVTAGSYILSKEALMDMYYGSMYTQHFRFDDVFLGLVAKKVDIEPFHCDEFHFYKKDYTKFNYKYVITSHGYENPEELLRVWNEQKAIGNA